MISYSGITLFGIFDISNKDCSEPDSFDNKIEFCEYCKDHIGFDNNEINPHHYCGLCPSLYNSNGIYFEDYSYENSKTRDEITCITLDKGFSEYYKTSDICKGITESCYNNNFGIIKYCVNCKEAFYEYNGKRYKVDQNGCVKLGEDNYHKINLECRNSKCVPSFYDEDIDCSKPKESGKAGCSCECGPYTMKGFEENCKDKIDNDCDSKIDDGDEDCKVRFIEHLPKKFSNWESWGDISISEGYEGDYSLKISPYGGTYQVVNLNEPGKYRISAFLKHDGNGYGSLEFYGSHFSGVYYNLTKKWENRFLEFEIGPWYTLPVGVHVYFYNSGEGDAFIDSVTLEKVSPSPILDKNCVVCGCQDGYFCDIDNKCKIKPKCEDETLVNTCSLNKPNFCYYNKKSKSYELFENCKGLDFEKRTEDDCGCPYDLHCSEFGECITPIKIDIKPVYGGFEFETGIEIPEAEAFLLANSSSHPKLERLSGGEIFDIKFVIIGFFLDFEGWLYNIFSYVDRIYFYYEIILRDENGYEKADYLFKAFPLVKDSKVSPYFGSKNDKFKVFIEVFDLNEDIDSIYVSIKDKRSEINKIKLNKISDNLYEGEFKPNKDLSGSYFFDTLIYNKEREVFKTENVGFISISDSQCIPIYNGGIPDGMNIIFLGDKYSNPHSFIKNINNVLQDFLQDSTIGAYKNKINFNFVARDLNLGCSTGEHCFSPNLQKIFESQYKTFTHSSGFYDHYFCCDDNNVFREAIVCGDYDQIIVLVNDSSAGGGYGGSFRWKKTLSVPSFTNKYSISVVSDLSDSRIPLHEFGHTFGGLYDYYNLDPNCEEHKCKMCTSRYNFSQEPKCYDQPIMIKKLNEKICGAEIPYISQNYPNPFNPKSKKSGYRQTKIDYEVYYSNKNEDPCYILLEIFNINGEIVRYINSKTPLKSGEYTFIWDGKTIDGDLAPNGVYFFQISAGGKSKRIKGMIV